MRRARRQDQPSRLSSDLDAELRPAQSVRSDRIDRHPLRSRRLSAELPARPAAIRGAQAKADRASRRQGRRPGQARLGTIPDGPLLKLGVENEQVALLRKRLDIPAETQTPTNEASTSRCSKRCGTSSSPMALFPTAWSAPARGGCSTAARRSRVRPATRRGSERCLINMERWRWLPHDLGAYYVTVNIPEFMLRVVEDDKRGPHHARGRRQDRQADADVLQRRCRRSCSVRIWNVPTSIKIEEIGPYLRQEAPGSSAAAAGTPPCSSVTTCASKYGGREIDPAAVDWNQVDIRNSEIYPAPGPGNVLGRVKFVFPNKHDVYMHDTPQKFLFAQCRPGRKPWLHAGAKSRSAGRRAAEARPGLEPGADHLGHRDRLRPARCPADRRFRSTSPTSPLR